MGAKDSGDETGEEDVVSEVVLLEVIGHCVIKSLPETFRHCLTTCHLYGPYYSHGKTIAKFHCQGRT